MTDDFLPEMEPDGDYYSCSDKQEHSPNCKEIDESHEAWEYGYKRLFINSQGKEVGCEVVSKWDIGIFKENQKWKELGISRQNITKDQLEVEARIKTILDILVSSGICTLEEMNEKYQINLLRDLKAAREEITPVIEQMRRQAIAAPTGLTMPPGFKGN